MTDKQKRRVARKAHKKAVMHLHISNRYGALTEQGEKHFAMYKYFMGIVDSYEAAEKAYIRR